MPTRARIIQMYEIGKDNVVTSEEVAEFSTAASQELMDSFSSLIEFTAIMGILGICGVMIAKNVGGSD